MNKRILIALFLCVSIVACTKDKPQTLCPVMGEEINKTLYVDAEGYRIYVCCKGCISAIKADPEKYIQQLKADGVALEKAPASEKTDHSQHHH